MDEAFQVEYLWTFGWHHNIKQITYRALHKGWNTGLPFIVDQKILSFIGCLLLQMMFGMRENPYLERVIREIKGFCFSVVPLDFHKDLYN